MRSTVLYFAYGSNLSRARLGARLPAAAIGTGRLAGHRLSFRKRSDVDGSAKCDIEPAPADEVFGMLYRLAAADLPSLDAIEGGYERDEVGIEGADGALVRAVTYRALVIDDRLKPFDWYHHHVLHGAREAGLPRRHIARIETIEAVRDPDAARRRRELAIYR